MKSILFASLMFTALLLGACGCQSKSAHERHETTQTKTVESEKTVVQ